MSPPTPVGKTQRKRTPARVYARPPKHLLKPMEEFTEQDKKDFEAFVDEFVRRLAEASGREPKTGEKLEK